MLTPLAHRAIASSFVLALTIFAGKAAAQQLERPSGDPSFIPFFPTLETLVDGDKEDLVITEGVVVTCDNRVLFSDITVTAMKPAKNGALRAGQILEYKPDTGKISVFRSPSGMANGNRMDLQCNLLTAEMADFGGRRLIRTDMKTGRAEIVAGLYDGKPFNSPNDIALDKQGRMYITDPRYVGQEPVQQPTQGVYRVDTNGTVTRIISDAGKPNGLAICGDEQRIFVGSLDNGVLDFTKLKQGEKPAKGIMALMQYDLDSNGNAANRRVLVDYAPEDGPDGMVCDTEGNLWVAVRSEKKPGVYAYEIRGNRALQKAYVPTPKIPSNVHFARGRDANYLYITAGNSLYGIKVGKKGYHLQ
jgi:gluconolactonase